ncbi:hypothetical protein AAG570_005343 [Ranatra chinensis]|uniref:Hexosyltransferase n=1 Tax=Ranatra chinensis TaxID=642074 RepID=A0ABD0Y062_9HEMI
MRWGGATRVVTHGLALLLGCTVTLYLVGPPRHHAPHYQPDRTGHPSRQSSSYLLVIAVLSASDHAQQREAIRQTWGGRLNRAVRLFFVVGAAPSRLEHNLKAEHEANGDLLRVQAPESYRGLTRKLLDTLKRLHADYRFDYLLKVDDDSFVQLDGLIEELRGLEGPLYWGYFQGRGTVFQEGRWKETNWFLCDRYLPYAYGGGYVLSHNLVQFIVQNADMLSEYNSEDVSVATWLAPLKLNRVHDARFNTQTVSRGCRNSHLILHKQSPDDMRRLHLRLQTAGTLCPKEFDSIVPYTYNWKALPSKCCKTEQ